MRLYTKRLLIRSFTTADVDDYAAIAADPCVMRFLGDGLPLSSDLAEEYVQDCIMREMQTGISRYTIALKDTGQLIGFSGFKEMNGYIDFGYRLAAAVWGRGYATEAGHRVIRYAWEELGVDELLGAVMPKNLASSAVLKKCGFLPHQNSSQFDPAFEWFILRKPN